MLDWAGGVKPIDEILLDLEQARRAVEAEGDGT